MIAFFLSFFVVIAGVIGIVVYGRRRPVGAPLTWGEAIAAAVLAFALMFFAYGVVPHQWLTWTGNELEWRPDRIVVGPNRILEKLPFDMSWETVSHILVSAIYGLFLALHVALWAVWQNRGKKKPAELPRTAYGRPLVKQG